jgi:hypothetical protein
MADNAVNPGSYVWPYQLAPDYVNGKYYFENFKDGHKPFLYTVSATGIPAVATTAAGADVVHEMMTHRGYWQVYNTTDQAVLPFATAGSGLDISGDLVENESLELVPGGNFASSRLAFVVGTDANFFMRAKYKITDVSGLDQAVFAGFRKQETFAAPTSLLTTGDAGYVDFFGIGLSEEDGVDLKTMSDVDDSGSTTVTDTGFDLTDSEVFEVAVWVKGGVPKCFINGIALGNPVAKDGDGTAITSQSTVTTASYTFTSGLTLIPWVFVRHDDEIGNAVCLQEIEIGHLRDIGADKDAEIARTR